MNKKALKQFANELRKAAAPDGRVPDWMINDFRNDPSAAKDMPGHVDRLREYSRTQPLDFEVQEVLKKIDKDRKREALERTRKQLEEEDAYDETPEGVRKLREWKWREIQKQKEKKALKQFTNELRKAASGAFRGR